jgi:hypothetical protein
MRTRNRLKRSQRFWISEENTFELIRASPHRAVGSRQPRSELPGSSAGEVVPVLYMPDDRWSPV